jgi:hypothetical protein
MTEIGFLLERYFNNRVICFKFVKHQEPRDVSATLRFGALHDEDLWRQFQEGRLKSNAIIA